MESSSNVTDAALEKMRALDTDALVRIWREGDRSEYSVVEQEAARKVLVERLGGLPGVATETGKAVVFDTDDDDDDAEEAGFSRWTSFLATLAAIVSWPLLALFLGLGGYTFWQTLQQGRQMGASWDQILLQMLNPLNYLLIGLFYFIVLQFVAKAIAMLQDIWEYAGYLVDRK